MKRVTLAKTLIGSLILSVSGVVECFGQCGTPCPAPGTLNSFVNLGRPKTGYIESYQATAEGEDYTIIGGGQDTWDRNDELAFAYHEFYGDFDIKVRVESIEWVARWAKAGIMARESLAEDARRVAQTVSPPAMTMTNGQTGANTMEFLWRTGINDEAGDNGGQHSVSIGAPPYPNAWIRLVRRGNTITGYGGSDGVNWPWSYSVDTSTWQGGPLPKKLYVGLSVSRHPDANVDTCRTIFRSYQEGYATAGEKFCLEAADSRGCPQKVLLTFNRPVGPSALDPNNYSWNGPTLIEGAEPGPTPNTVWLITEAVDMTEGYQYEIQALVEDENGNPIDPSCWTASFVHGQGYEQRLIHVTHNKLGTSTLDVYKQFTGLALGMGAWVEDRPPAESNSLFEDPMPDGDPANDYGASIVGVLQVPADGNYRFACSSDDVGELYLSTDDQPSHKQLIAREPVWNGSRQYATPDRRGIVNGHLENQSDPIPLQAGKKYFLQYAYQEGGGGNNGSVTWDAGTGADFQNGQTPIEEANFVPSRYAWGYIFYNLGECQILNGPNDQLDIPIGDTAVFEVTLDGTPPYSFTWYTNGVVAAQNYSPRLVIPDITASHHDWRIQVCVTNACGGVCSAEARLTVKLNPKVDKITSKGNCHAFYVTWNTTVNLDGTYSVLASNTVDSTVDPINVTGLSYGASQREVVVSVDPDLLPSPWVYHVVIQDVTSLASLTQDPNPAYLVFEHGAEYTPFRILWKQYFTAGGPMAINSFLALPKVVNDQPDVIRTFNAFETPGGENGANYGAIMLGWVVVPQDGDYRLWTASDDYSVTYIATDGNPAHKVPVAYEPQWNDWRDFATCDRRTCGPDGWPVETQSPVFTLTQGQVVYLEAVYTEGGGGDHYSAYVTVVPVGDPNPGPPPDGTPSNLTADLFVAKRRAPNGCIFDTLCDVFCTVQDQTQYENLPVTFTAKADGTPAAATCYYYQWLSNGVPIVGANGPSYTTPPVTLADDGTVYTCEVRNDFSTNTCSATLHVAPNPILLSCDSRNSPNKVWVRWNKPVALTGTYTLTGGLNPIVNSISYGADHSEVVLDTEELGANIAYTLTVTGETAEEGGAAQTPDPAQCGFYQGPGRICYDFNDGQVPPGTLASGTTPPYVGPELALHLTDPVNSQANFWTIPLDSPRTFTGFRAQWKTLLGPADNFGNRADGFSFNVGQNIGTAFTPEEGAPTGLAVCVDTYNNGGSEVGLEIRWNGVRQAFMAIHGGARHGPEELMKQQWVDSYVDVTPSGFVTFRYDTYQITAQLPNYSGIVVNQYVFAARTGGANENCWIDDLCINDFTIGPISDVTVSPTSVTVVEGRLVTFSASASGSPPYTYQWERNDGLGWTEIPGAINPIYSFVASLADNGASYRVRVANGFSSGVSDAATVTVVPLQYGMGAVLFEVYNTGLGDCGAGYSEVDKLTNHPSFPNNPVERYYLSRFDTRAAYPDDSHEGYGGRLSGLFYPPQTGDWVFYLRSDDASQLYLNTNGPDPAGKVLIAQETGCCHAFADVHSEPIHLEAGQAYYIEALYKEGCGGDYCQVAALPAGEPPPIDPTTQSIPGAWLAAAIDPNANASVAITQDPTNACAILQPPSPPSVLLSSDFGADDGGFWVTNFPSGSGALPPGPWTWQSAAGTWSCFGEDCPPFNGPYASGLVSPPIVVPSAGGVAVTFAHRYSFESGAWDGGVLVMSVNGGAWTVVPPANYMSNGPNGVILGNSIGGNLLTGEPAFVNESPDYASGTFITSSAGLGFFNAGDVIVLGFLSSWDEGCQGSVPNWEIDRVEVSLGVEVPVSAEFTVAATASAYGIPMEPAYQWQRNDGLGWVDIPGANGSTYTLAGVQLSDNGAKFRCVARVPGASATSGEATLTVIAGCGSISVERQGLNPADAVIITWNSVTWEPGQYCELYGAEELVNGGPGTVWVKIQASDPDVISLEPGKAVMRPTMRYKFFRTASPLSCP